MSNTLRTAIMESEVRCELNGVALGVRTPNIHPALLLIREFLLILFVFCLSTFNFSDFITSCVIIIRMRIGGRKLFNWNLQKTTIPLQAVNQHKKPASPGCLVNWVQEIHICLTTCQNWIPDQNKPSIDTYNTLIQIWIGDRYDSALHEIQGIDIWLSYQYSVTFSITFST